MKRCDCAASEERSAGEILGAGQAIVAVIGCGGKTTFIESLARQLAHKRVLISPTTKIMPILADDVILCETLRQCVAHQPMKGIQCMGVKNQKTGKLEALPQELLETVVPLYDIVLLEADGSAGLPLKGWADFEPCIPPYCTHTVGIVTPNAAGLLVSGLTVHRVELFTRLTGLNEGEAVTMRAVADMICKPGGMFWCSVGKRFLFINQTESPEQVERAKELALEVMRNCGAAIECVAYGSARLNKWTEVDDNGRTDRNTRRR